MSEPDNSQQRQPGDAEQVDEEGPAQAGKREKIPFKPRPSRESMLGHCDCPVEPGKPKKLKIKCAIHNKCPHNRLIFRCKDCDGEESCSHAHYYYYCIHCGPGICEHGTQKRHCSKEPCRSNSTLRCTHNKERNKCRDCGGTAFCKPHGKDKFRCKICKLDQKEACESLLLMASTIPPIPPSSTTPSDHNNCPSCAAPMGAGGMPDALCGACERAKRPRKGA